MARLIVCRECKEEKEHYAKNCCRICYWRLWRATNHDRAIAYGRRWRLENPEKSKAASRKYKKANREQCRVYGQQYRTTHREQEQSRTKKWYEENRERALVHQAGYRATHRKERAATEACRRARKRGLPNTLTPAQAMELMRIGQAIYPGEKLHLDHIVPLSKGGGTTRANMHAIPAKVNLQKYDNLPEEIYNQAELL